MKKFFTQILNKINKFDNYTNQYLKLSNNIEIPALAYTNWGLKLADEKNFDSAIEKLETAVLMSNQNPKPCISLGVIYAKLKDYKNAELYLKYAIKRDSQNAYPYSVLGSVLTASSKFSEAEENFKKALKLAPHDSEIYLNYGVFYIKLQKKVKAVEILKKAKACNPSNPHVLFMLGMVLFELNKAQEAFCEFKLLEELIPDYKNLNYYLALCYKKEKNYMAVLEYAQRASNENPLNPDIYILLAQNYFDLNDKDKALQTFEYAFQKGISDFELFLAWGISLIKLNNIQEAKNKILKALEIKPDNDNAFYQLGCCFFKENNTERAEELFRKAIEINPENSSALADLGVLLYRKEDFRSAVSIMFNAIDLNSKNSFLYFYIANTYFKEGKYKKSIEFYDKTLEYYPNHTEALINYAITLLRTDSIKEALRKIRSAYHINKNSNKIMLIYALSALKAGINSDAVEKADFLIQNIENNKRQTDINESISSDTELFYAVLIKAQALINLNKAQEAVDLLSSLDENMKNSDIFYYLSFFAYKILVEDNPSQYNKNMFQVYADKINKLKGNNSEINPINSYLNETLNINKG